MGNAIAYAQHGVETATVEVASFFAFLALASDRGLLASGMAPQETAPPENGARTSHKKSGCSSGWTTRSSPCCSSPRRWRWCSRFRGRSPSDASGWSRSPTCSCLSRSSPRHSRSHGRRARSSKRVVRSVRYSMPQRQRDALFCTLPTRRVPPCGERLTHAQRGDNPRA